MYQIYCDNLLIFDDTSPDASLRLESPKLTLTANAAGSLSFGLPVTNVGYTAVQRILSTIHVHQDGEEIWQGRILSENYGFQMTRNIICEGAMSYLNDTILAPETLPGATGIEVLAFIVDKHNTALGSGTLADRRKVFAGNCTMTGTYTVELDYTRSIDGLMGLVNDYGGVMKTRIVNGLVLVDWLAEYPAITGQEQSVELGQNLMDFSITQDDGEYCTAVWVKGHDQEVPDPTNPEETVTAPLVERVVSSAASTFGIIDAFLNFDDLTTSAELLYEGSRYLAERQYDGMTLSLTALDLHMINPAIRPFRLLERVHVTSYPHGMDRYFAVLGLEIQLGVPDGTTFILGDPSVAYKRRVKTLTERAINQEDLTADEMAQNERESKERDDALDGKIDDETAARISAIEDTIRRMNAGTRGYVTIDYSATQGAEGTDGIYITDEKLSTEDGMTMAERLADAEVQKLWKWTMDGLGFSPNAGQTYKVAITMDGEILSEFIKLYGDLSVFQSQTGPLGGKLGFGLGNNEISSTPGIHMYDPSENVEVIVTSAGARMSFANYHLYIASNGVVVVNSADPQLGVPVTINGDLTVTGTINGQVI